MFYLYNYKKPLPRINGVLANQISKHFFKSFTKKENNQFDNRSLRPSMIISTVLLDKFSSEIAALRKAAAPSNDTVLVDFIDEQCYHFLLYHHSTIVGSVRISSSMNSILNQWYGQFPFPTDRNTAELTKAVILPTYQNMGLYKLMMLEVLLRLPSLGYNKANAGVRPNLLQRSFLKSIGFSEYHKTIFVRDKNSFFEGIPISLSDIDEKLIQEKYFSHINSLNNKNVIVKSSLLKPSSLLNSTFSPK